MSSWWVKDDAADTKRTETDGPSVAEEQACPGFSGLVNDRGVVGDGRVATRGHHDDVLRGSRRFFRRNPCAPLTIVL